ncbi:MAG TPA: hypothetical protein EYN58_03195 [Candidatus Poseidoniales archaeon]|jgi:hypothetical protein|nr:MAG: hypothetical protein CXX81_25330 [Euryarchaeota archaeon]HHZ74182.1 hypothetical protein [Candidatus Poseidoniales archaeon]PXY75677.1 MAG: hypothetical protein CXX81_17555 [Euryarchaeota archaeon]PXY78391.1 MAG: hypothetical protein CXX81_08000 [Euryarchaeota archaeon]PXY79598.1 MAG: hypothetical protein CXX81_01775 [Euryarchaeota archaeon]
MEWYYWAAIIVAIIIILPDPIGMLFGWLLDKWFNEFEEKGTDVSQTRLEKLREAGHTRDLNEHNSEGEPDE